MSQAHLTKFACRSFGRFTLVGTHVINTIHKFLYQPVTKRDKEAAAAAAAKKARKKGNFAKSSEREGKEVNGRPRVTRVLQGWAKRRPWVVRLSPPVLMCHSRGWSLIP